MRGILKNKKGLTLIELLAVLVIVGIIAAIAVPAINGTIKNAKTKADEATQTVIKEAAMRYAIDKQLTSTDNRTTTQLVSDGYLNATPTWNFAANEKDTANIAVDASGNYTVTLSKSS